MSGQVLEYFIGLWKQWGLASGRQMMERGAGLGEAILQLCPGGQARARQRSLRTEGRGYVLYVLEGSRHNLDLILSSTGRL